MSTSIAPPAGPQAALALPKATAQNRAAEDTTISRAPLDAKQSTYLDLAITFILHRWPALTTAVAESWGGPTSPDKRDWLAGVISDLYAHRPETDEEDVELVLLQVMEDEFEARLEDGSEIEVAGEICRLRRMVGRGEFGEIEALRAQWERRKGKPERGLLKGQVERRGVDDEDDDDSDDEDEDGGVQVQTEGDAEMTDAPDLATTKEKPPPEIDDEGFTKVVGKKK